MSGGAARYIQILDGERKDGDRMPVWCDLHVHGLLSKTYAFDVAAVEQLQRTAVDRRLDAFALTEHIHAADFWRIQELLSKRYRYRDGVYHGGRVPMLSGAEITCREAGDLIIVGELETIRELDRRFVPRLSEGTHPTLTQFLDVAGDLPLIKIGAHPFRPGKELHRRPAAELARLDAIEVNGRDTFCLQHNVARVYQLANSLRRPIVGSSDTHAWPQLGVVSTRLMIAAETDVTLSAIRDAIVRHQTAIRLHAEGGALVRFCRAYKKYVKASRVAERPRLGEEVA
jgi:histidinol phosphatase-like PHP family hydrolase